jgi:signal transduction histidine kinase
MARRVVFVGFTMMKTIKSTVYSNNSILITTVMLLLLTLFFTSLSTANPSASLNDIVNPKLIELSQWQTRTTNDEQPSKQTYDWQNLNKYKETRRFSLVAKERLYKANFIIGWHHRTRDLAISIGPLKGADAIYINGYRVDNATNSKVNALFKNSSRVYRLPRNKIWFSWFNYTKTNELIIKINTSKNGHSLNQQRIEIGDYETLALKATDFDSTIKTIQGAAIAFIFILVLFTIFLKINLYDKKSNSLFGSFVFLISLSIAASSLFFPKYSDHSDLLLSFSEGLNFISLIVFLRIVSEKFHLPSPSYQKSLEACGLITVILLMTFAYDYHLRNWPSLVLFTIMCTLLTLHIYQLLTSNINDVAANYSIIFALIIILISFSYDGLWGENSWPLTPYHIGAILSSMFLLYSIAQDFKKMTLSMRSMSSRLVNIREIERARLTRDIHDGVGQGLATIRLFITMNINNFEPQLGAALKHEVDHTSNTLKSVIRNLKPIEMDGADYCGAIIELARHLCKIAQIELCVIGADKTKMDSEVAYQLYRIGQEALINAIKHSACSLITVDICSNQDILQISITDNGKGMSQKQDDLGYGLSSMHERALLIRAKLRVSNNINGGTHILLEVPIND